VAEVVASGEDGVDRVAGCMDEMITADAVFGFGMTDDQLDSRGRSL
jgi:hypothetical protein